jgi:hypothetical protein
MIAETLLAGILVRLGVLVASFVFDAGLVVCSFNFRIADFLLKK